MRNSLKTLLDSCKLLVMFIGCTVLFYYGLKWLDHHYASSHKYDQPSDGAVKVIGPVNQPAITTNSQIKSHFFQFLRDGE